MANPAVQITERRSEKRTTAHHDLTPFLRNVTSDEVIRSILIDISTIGIGIRSFDFIKPYSEVRIQCGNDVVLFRVAWARGDSTKDGLWHIGLLALNSSIDLKSWFKNHDLELEST